jgi:hypothetical protein
MTSQAASTAMRVRTSMDNLSIRAGQKTNLARGEKLPSRITRPSSPSTRTVGMPRTPNR